MPMLCLGLMAGAATAQEDNNDEAMYYVADYNIAWESLMEWNNIYQKHSVPILQALVDEEVISGWSAWMHNTGGDYNWRMVISSANWDNMDNFWDEYLSRFPEKIMQETGHILTSHRDQIWDAALVKYADDASETKYIYEALYQVNFGDMQQWNQTMQDKEVPMWDKAMDNDIIKGYVVLGHNTGDRYNHGRVYLFTEWDKMDDFNGMMMENIVSDPQLWTKIGSMMQAHTDVIWERVPSQAASSSQ